MPRDRSSEVTGLRSFEPAEPHPTVVSVRRWPRVIGTIGIVLGVLACLDQLDDLVTMTWTAGDWQRIRSPGITQIIIQEMPSVGWRMLAVAVELGLGILLIVGSLAVRRRQLFGVFVCRVWAILAIAWTVLAIGWAISWVEQLRPSLQAASPGPWESLGFVLPLIFLLMLAYPVFLLVWFANPRVHREYDTWSSLV